MLARRSFVLGTAAALAGCASATLDPQARASIKSVYVEPAVLPELPTVVGPDGGALAVVAGKSAPAGKDAALRLKSIVDTQVRLGALIRDVAARELQSRGYRMAESADASDARLRFTVFHGLGVAGAVSNARGIAMTVNMELVRVPDQKRLVFGIANQVDAEVRPKTRQEPFDAWFANESLTAEQYRLIAENLVAQSLRGI